MVIFIPVLSPFISNLIVSLGWPVEPVAG
jgi:hypothetical protein